MARVLLPLLLLLGAALPCAAQEVTPRTYANTPTGVNFLAVGYGYSEGDLEFDGAVAVEGAEGTLHSVFARYVRAFDLFGRTAKLKVALPYVAGDWRGAIRGVDAERKSSGLGDLQVTGEWLFYGAGARTLETFEEPATSTIAGLSLTVVAPTGTYERDRGINIGSNRWTWRPELGIAHQRGAWTFELAGRVWVYGDNDDFFGGNRLEQRPFWAGYGAVIYQFRPGVWLAGGVGYGEGGRTSVNGVSRDTYQENWRFAVMGSYAITRAQGVSLILTSAVNRGVGSEPDTVTVAYQLAFLGP